MSEKTAITFQASVEFRDALGVYSASNNTTVSAVIRKAVAQLIDYDLQTDVVALGRPKVYDSKEDRLSKQKSDRQLAKKLLEDFNQAVRRNDVKTLEEYLLRRGHDLES